MKITRVRQRPRGKGAGGWEGLLAPTSFTTSGTEGASLAQCWYYLQSEVGSGEGHLGEAYGPRDVMIATQDGDTLCQPSLEGTGKHEQGGVEEWHEASGHTSGLGVGAEATRTTLSVAQPTGGVFHGSSPQGS